MGCGMSFAGCVSVEAPLCLPFGMFQSGKPFAGRCQSAEQGCELLPLLPDAGKCIQQTEVVFRFEQGLGIVLTVNIDQAGGDV